MEYYPHPHLNKDTNLQGSFVPRLMNFIALGIQGFLAYTLYHLGGIVDATLLIVYGTTMGWSLGYHLLPFLTHNIVFRFLHKIFSFAVYFLTIGSIYMYIMTEHDWAPDVYLALFLYLFAPSSFLAFTLNWLMGANRQLGGSTIKEMPNSPNIVYVSQSKVQPNGHYTMI